MFNFDYVTKEYIKEHNSSQREIREYLYRI